ncbi:MAG: LicD family protein [Lachnospiraceae bacterium]|nr:LicD family protein [Lachnospiraceae bacterium]
MNEFELDWAQAPVRSELIPGSKLKGANILLVGEQPELQKAVAWSFLAWNDSIKANLRVMSARCTEGKLQTEQVYSEEAFALEKTDYVILTGFCCREATLDVVGTIEYLQHFGALLEAVFALPCRRTLLLSDGRVYGKLGYGFAASEYEAGTTDPCAPGYEAQYLLQTMEGMLTLRAREKKAAFNILRTGLIYGPRIPMMAHPAAELAGKTAAGQEVSLTLSQDRNSYISIHDVLTAIQFVLVKCPGNKIFNVSGLASNASAGELAIMLYNNFPDRCRISMSSGTGRTPQTDGASREKSVFQTGEASRTNAAESEAVENTGIWLNTQLIEHYGFEPKVSLEDGLIILVKSLQNTGEVFIFDNTYLGKLEKVQQILLGYLLEIDRICKKHNIKYFLAGGTLLGAIRHHGFIPWDDDADVMMLREDYDKFQQVVQQELPDNIFMQIPETEKGNYNPFTKLRINNTMFATEFTGHFMDMHNGIFFDVLSHDRTGRHKWSQKLHLMVTMLTRSVVFNKWGDTDIKGGGAHPIICKIVDHVKYLIPMRFALWAQNRSLEFFKNRKTEYLYDGMGRNLKRGSFPAAWLEEAVYVDFEGYQFPVPKEYDKYLTYLYGDYMQMIPVSQRRTSHSIVLMDLGEYAGFTLK